MTETLPEITPGVKAASAVLKKYGRRSTWERARNRGIGASETPIILGLTTWGSPVERTLERARREAYFRRAAREEALRQDMDERIL